MNIQKQKIIFVGGKGGVGKSTSSAALALANAQSGNNTLVVSTDPAHNLGDVFHQPLSHEKTKLSNHLWGIEIDSATETKRYMNQVKDNLKGLVKSKMVEEVHRQIDLASASPGAEEAALFDRLITILIEEQVHFDKIIFDTAPTGHTIRLLTLPELMNVWIDGMLEKRQKINDNYTQLLNDGEPVDDPIYDILQQRKEKFSQARDIILDEDITGFVFVLIPERLPIIETKQAIKQLNQFNLHVKNLIVNKVLPKEADGQFLEKRRQIENNYLQNIDEQFKNQAVLKVPLYEEDISDLDRLSVFAEQLSSLIKTHV
ncbi:arsenite-transporting ATPase [Alkalibacillus filiformis]|uniref:Arsenite-transporting ATPase n=1 Tax=Alkalibacillus filiformis TaxID=200990 RepID=A0ABU0DX81_9BACI|nr:ArsA family ATPase [Alkalibacillus filiformis]MDQ0352996.1 arsenite-transporting ATPase [Alkalibacillus filiformis]